MVDNDWQYSISFVWVWNSNLSQSLLSVRRENHRIVFRNQNYFTLRYPNSPCLSSTPLPFPSLLFIDGFFSQFFLSVIEPWELTTSCHSVYPWMLDVVKFLFHQIAVSKRRVRLSSEITFAVTPRRRSMPAPIAVRCSQRPLSSRITNTASQSAVCSHAFLRFSGFSFFVCIILAFWWSPVGALC